ncbi:TPA: DUF2933 domain-containing protein [Morganella morganii]|uniref:DUF2933 domain-containing protein n=1 Tax=Morganella morganii TaxID=582 RepID=UPI0038628428
MYEFFRDNWFLLMLLICPLMHFFMHKGHSSHSHCDHNQHNEKTTAPQEEKKHIDA